MVLKNSIRAAPRAVIYVRVSDPRQKLNNSLPEQQKVCREHCSRLGIEVAEVFVEGGKSAKTTKRLALQNTLIYCAKNKGRIDFFVVDSLNRFARQMEDHHYVKRILAGLGIRLMSATQQFEESPEGHLHENMVVSLAQYDNESKGKLTMDRMKAAVNRGRWTFPPPIGYKKGTSNLEHDEQKAPFVRMAFELYATGAYQREQVLRKVNAAGLRTRKGKKLSSQTLCNMLKNPLYSGRIVVPRWGIDRPGNFKPIVSEALFLQVQGVLAGKGKGVEVRLSQNPDFPLRPWVKCSKCNRPLTASNTVKKPSQTKYPFYWCRHTDCKFISCRKEKIEASFIELMRFLQPKTTHLRLMNAILLDVWKEAQRETSDLQNAVNRKTKDIAERRKRLVEAHVYRQTIPDDIFQEQLGLLKAEEAEAGLELRAASLDEIDVDEVVSYANDVLTDAAGFWVRSSVDQKQRFQSILFPEGVCFDGAGFGTPATCFVISYLRDVSAQNVSLASRTGVEPAPPS
jgi:DNA invertase Pin-like site-specific DNA recombinase